MQSPLLEGLAPDDVENAIAVLERIARDRTLLTSIPRERRVALRRAERVVDVQHHDGLRRLAGVGEQLLLKLEAIGRDHLAGREVAEDVFESLLGDGGRDDVVGERGLNFRTGHAGEWDDTLVFVTEEHAAVFVNIDPDFRL